MITKETLARQEEIKATVGRLKQLDPATLSEEMLYAEQKANAIIEVAMEQGIKGAIEQGQVVSEVLQSIKKTKEEKYL